MNVAAGGPAAALGRGPAGSPRRAARPFEYGRRASMASLRIGEPPRSRARGPQGPFVQVLNCPPKRVRSTVPLGGVAVLRNRDGFYACLHILEILDESRVDDRDEPRFRYAIQSNGSDDFAEFMEIDP